MHPDDHIYAMTIDRSLTAVDAQHLATSLAAEGWIRLATSLVGGTTLALILASLPDTWDDATREEIYQHCCAVLGWAPGRTPMQRAHNLDTRLAPHHLALHRQLDDWIIEASDGRALIRAQALDAIEAVVIALERPLRLSERVALHRRADVRPMPSMNLIYH